MVELRVSFKSTILATFSIASIPFECFLGLAFLSSFKCTLAFFHNIWSTFRSKCWISAILSVRGISVLCHFRKSDLMHVISCLTSFTFWSLFHFISIPFCPKTRLGPSSCSSSYQNLKLITKFWYNAWWMEGFQGCSHTQKGSLHHREKFWSISILSTLSKILERYVRIVFYDYLKHFNIDAFILFYKF